MLRAMRMRIVSLLLLLCLGSAFGAETNRYEIRAEHDRDGIGKFYMGREIAHVMGHQAADWLERPNRNEEENTELLVETLKFKPGETVADIGVGTGYHTRRIAPKIVPGGKVYAVDIQQEMLDLLTNKLARLGITKSAIYHHVSSKDELLRLAVNRALDGLFAVTEEPTTSPSSLIPIP